MEEWAIRWRIKDKKKYKMKNKTRNNRELFIQSRREETESDEVNQKMKKERIKSSSIREKEVNRDFLTPQKEESSLVSIRTSTKAKFSCLFCSLKRQMWSMETTRIFFPLATKVAEWIFTKTNHCFKPSILVNSAEREKTRQTIKEKRHSTRPGDR